ETVTASPRDGTIGVSFVAIWRTGMKRGEAWRTSLPDVSGQHRQREKSSMHAPNDVWPDRPRRAKSSWVQILPGADGASQLDVHCCAFSPVGFGEDLGSTGSGIQWKSLSRCFFGDWRRLNGFGSPVVV